MCNRKNEKYGIYTITCTVTSKQYVGMSMIGGIYNRWNTHRDHLTKGIHVNTYLQRAWDKYGAESFSFEVVEEHPYNDPIIKEREIYWIDKLDTYHNGYNLTKGGEGTVGYKYTEYQKQALRDYRKAHPFTSETRKLWSSQRSGVPKSDSHREGLRCGSLNMSAENKAIRSANITRWNQSPEGRERARQAALKENLSEETLAKRKAKRALQVFSPETCAKISASKKGKPQPTSQMMTEAASEKRARTIAERQKRIKESGFYEARHTVGILHRALVRYKEQKIKWVNDEYRLQHIIDLEEKARADLVIAQAQLDSITTKLSCTGTKRFRVS